MREEERGRGNISLDNRSPRDSDERAKFLISSPSLAPRRHGTLSLLRVVLDFPGINEEIFATLSAPQPTGEEEEEEEEEEDDFRDEKGGHRHPPVRLFLLLLPRGG